MTQILLLSNNGLVFYSSGFIFRGSEALKIQHFFPQPTMVAGRKKKPMTLSNNGFPVKPLHSALHRKSNVNRGLLHIYAGSVVTYCNSKKEHIASDLTKLSPGETQRTGRCIFQTYIPN